jgi:hypothetical protein
MADAKVPRSFVVTVRSAPARVVVEDVRGRRQASAPDVAAAGAQIERWLGSPGADAVDEGPDEAERSVTGPA